MSINMCGSLAFPFDLGTSLFVFILLSLLREAICGKFSSRVTCFKREKVDFKSEEIDAAIEAAFLRVCVDMQNVITERGPKDS